MRQIQLRIVGMDKTIHAFLTSMQRVQASFLLKCDIIKTVYNNTFTSKLITHFLPSCVRVAQILQRLLQCLQALQLRQVQQRHQQLLQVSRPVQLQQVRQNNPQNLEQ